MTVAEQLLDALEQLGVRYLFGLPGTTEVPFLDLLGGGRSVEYVLTLHENVTVAMADGYARGSGGLGVVNLHTSVGTANALSQLYNAHRDGSPLLVLAGHKSTALWNRDGFCVVEDLPAMARPFTKWSGQTIRPEQVADDLYRAAKVALSAPRGPVFLSIPEDLLAAAVPGTAAPQPAGRVPALSSRPEREALVRAAALLAQSQRPVIIAGDGVSRAGAQEALAALASGLGAVVLQEPRYGSVSWNFPTPHPHFAGEYAAEHPAVQESDCLFAAGCRLFVEFAPPRTPQVPPGAALIHLHEDPREVAKLYPVAVGLVGDVGAALAELQSLLAAEAGAGGRGEERSGRVAQHRRQYLADQEQARQEEAGQRPLRVSALGAALAEGLPADAVIVDEGICSSSALTRHYPLRYPNSYHRTGGGALGWGLAAAVGMQFAQPGRRVVAFSGDGSALFSIQSLWTAAHYNLPVLFLIANNRGYLAVKGALRRYGGLAASRGQYPGSAIDSPAPDFVRLAAGLGVPGRRADAAEELRDGLRAAMAADGPYLLEVAVAEEGA